MTTTPPKKTSALGFFAGLVLGMLCLGIAAHNSWTLSHLVLEGIRTDAEVIGVKAGAKGSKIARVRYMAEDGREVAALDMFQMLVIRHKTGEKVHVLYDPNDETTVIIDTGPWIWQQPVLLFLGGIFLIGLVSFLAMMERRKTDTKSNT